MSSRTIRDVIAGQQLITASVEMSVADTAKLMRDNRVGAMLILEDGKLAGIFTERDALFRVVAAEIDIDATPIAEVMTADPTTVGPDRTFDHALDLMHQGQFRHLPVVDGGELMGMVSSLDAMGPELEQFMYTVIVNEQNRDVVI